MRLVRHMDFQERESDGACHWKSISSKLRYAFLQNGGDTFSDDDWINHISSKTRFQYCKSSCSDLLKIRAFQGHTGGEVIALELMGHVAIPFKGKEFQFHRGCSFNSMSILDAGLVAGGKESKEGRQTVFFTPLDPWCGEN